MRMMMKITMQVEAGNKALQEGILQRTLQSTMERVRPEASYFGPDGGKRTAFMFFDLKDPSEIPSIVEPLFRALNAQVELTPVMNAQDLAAGLEKVHAK